MGLPGQGNTSTITRLEARLPTAWARGVPTIHADQPDASSDAQLPSLEASLHQRYSVSGGDRFVVAGGPLDGPVEVVVGAARE